MQRLSHVMMRAEASELKETFPSLTCLGSTSSHSVFFELTEPSMSEILTMSMVWVSGLPPAAFFVSPVRM